MRILIDTDAGEDVDDVLAIAFAARHRDIDLEAVTTVGCRPDDRARLVRKVLQLCGKQDVPVAAGEPSPLADQSPAQQAHYTSLTKTNHCGVVPDAERAALAPVAEPAADLIIRHVNAAPGEITLVAIGQLTNLAVALRRDPGIAAKLRAVALMGGETELLRAEHNILQDVVAADEVLRSGTPLFVGTWSVTRRFVLGPDDCRRLAAHGSALTDLLTRCIELWHPHQSWKPGPVMYDLAPIAWALDPSLVETRPMRLAVELTGAHTRGITMPIAGDPNAHVSTALDVPRLRDLYFRTLLG